MLLRYVAVYRIRLCFLWNATTFVLPATAYLCVSFHAISLGTVTCVYIPCYQSCSNHLLVVSYGTLSLTLWEERKLEMSVNKIDTQNIWHMKMEYIRYTRDVVICTGLMQMILRRTEHVSDVRNKMRIMKFVDHPKRRDLYWKVRRTLYGKGKIKNDCREI